MKCLFSFTTVNTTTAWWKQIQIHDHWLCQNANRRHFIHFENWLNVMWAKYSYILSMITTNCIQIFDWICDMRFKHNAWHVLVSCSIFCLNWNDKISSLWEFYLKRSNNIWRKNLYVYNKQIYRRWHSIALVNDTRMNWAKIWFLTQLNKIANGMYWYFICAYDVFLIQFIHVFQTSKPRSN